MAKKYINCFQIMLLAGAGLMCGVIAAGAEPLDIAQCGTVQTDREKLIGSGVLADIARGPAWAVINVSAERLKEIKQYIDLEEQFNFRCREAVPKKIKATGPNSAAAGTKPLAISPGDAVDLKIDPGLMPPAKPKRKPSAENSGAAAAKPKPKAREKSAKTDAYVPPPGSASSLTPPGLNGTDKTGPAETAKTQPGQSSGSNTALPPLTP